MTRIGKIARMFRPIREQLNRRMQDGEPGKELLDWLNALPKVQQVLAAQFGGRAISKQNLSEWKQGGYRDWERAEETRLRVSRLVDEAEELAESGNDDPLSERLAAVLVAELAGAIGALREESMPAAEHWRRLRELLRELAQVRRDGYRKAKLRIDQERWEWDSERLEREEHEHEIKEMKDKLCAPYVAAMRLAPMAQLFGGGELGRKMAAQMLEIEHELRPGTLTGDGRPDPVEPRRTKSSSRKGAVGSDVSSDPVRPSQTQSNQVKLDQGIGGEGSAESRIS